MAQVILAYRKLCELFEIVSPAIAPTQQCLFRLPDESIALDFSSLDVGDADALVLSCVLLGRARVSISLIREFITTFNEAVIGGAYVRYHVPSDSQLRIIFAEWCADASTPRYTQWRIANNPLTGRGAAALISAAIICGDGGLDLDLSTCRNVFTLDLSPWGETVRRILPFTSSPTFGLRGLRLDMCILKSFGKRPEELLMGLKWLSVRQTGLKNLWSVASILVGVNTLRAFLVDGRGDDIANLLKVRFLFSAKQGDSTRPATKRKTRTDSQRMEGSVSNSPGLQSLQHSSVYVSRSRSAPSGSAVNTSPAMEAPKLDGLASDIPYLPASHAQFICLGSLETPRTPVSKAPHYRNFLLVHAGPMLEILDDDFIAQRDVLWAKEIIDNHFQVHVRNTSPTAVSLPQLLRKREMDSSHARRVFRKPKVHFETTPKRRRNGSYDSRSPLFATRAGNLETILRSALQRSVHGELGVDTCVNSIPDSGNYTSSLYSTYSSSEVDVQRRDFNPVHTAAFDHTLFEGTFTNELAGKTGAPVAKYLCRPMDRPRQFEYNHLDTRLLVYGTEHSNLIVLDQDLMKVVGSCKVGGGRGHIAPGTSIETGFSEVPEVVDNGEGALRRRGGNVLGLSWFNKDPNLFVAGSENGSIQIYNVRWMATGRDGGLVSETHPFHHLTSLHVNSEDDKFLVSGYSHDVGLYDVSTGVQLELIPDCHTEHINVLKFSNHDPNVFVTSSFDHYVRKWDLRDRRPGGTRRPVFECKSDTGNVMVCFSPDDKYLLASGVDNEVRQYCSTQGVLDRVFDIPKTGSPYNYTRSYYMNGRDYVISGSCTEDVVRVYNARTGKFCREVELDNRSKASDKVIFVQSLRSNPRRRHNFSALLSANSFSPYFVIANVDLVSRA